VVAALLRRDLLEDVIFGVLSPVRLSVVWVEEILQELAWHMHFVQPFLTRGLVPSSCMRTNTGACDVSLAVLFALG
jgi:hypothetical protein